MLIGDWSSDVCSSDLGSGNRIIPARRIGNIQPNEERIATSSPDFGYDALGHLFIEVADYDLGAFFRETLRSEEQPSELQSLMRISYAVFCLKYKHNYNNIQQHFCNPLLNIRHE